MLRSPINNEVAFFIINIVAETLPFHHLIRQSHTRNETEPEARGKRKPRPGKAESASNHFARRPSTGVEQL